MNIEPLLHASPAIKFHVATVVPAAVLGAYVLWARKGTPRHRMLGRIWMVLMVLTSLSTFFIHTIRLWGPFSPIHLLSIAVIAGAYLAVRAARRRDIRQHKSMVTGMYVGGICIAGVFTLLPGRIMHQVVLGGSGSGIDSLGLLIAGAAIGIAVVIFRFGRGFVRNV